MPYFKTYSPSVSYSLLYLYNLKDGAVHLFVYGKGQLFPEINLGKKL